MVLRGVVSSGFLVVLFVSLSAMGISTRAAADGQRARFTVSVSVDGTESVVGQGGDSTEGTFHESFRLVTYLKSVGDPMEMNTKDPNYAQNMMAKSAAVQQKVREAQQAQGKSLPKMTPQQFGQYMQKKQAECKGDQNCLMALATEAGQLSANLAMDNQNSGVAPAQLSAEDSEPELRYQSYGGYDDCGASTEVKVDSTTSGTLADVGGPRKYTIKQKADYHGDANELRIICNIQNFVFDTKTQTLFTDGAIVPQVKGVRTEIINGKTKTSEGDLPMHGEALSWAGQQVRQAAASGDRSTTVKLTQQAQSQAIHTGKYSGEAKVKISWRFEPVVN